MKALSFATLLAVVLGSAGCIPELFVEKRLNNATDRAIRVTYPLHDGSQRSSKVVLAPRGTMDIPFGQVSCSGEAGHDLVFKIPWVLGAQVGGKNITYANMSSGALASTSTVLYLFGPDDHIYIVPVDFWDTIGAGRPIDWPTLRSLQPPEFPVKGVRVEASRPTKPPNPGQVQPPTGADNGMGCAGKASELHKVYGTLAADVAAYNGNPPRMDAWTMNPEHLFMGIDDPTAANSLRERCVAFSRQPGGLDLLFDKLLDHSTSESEILEVSEILVFFGQESRTGDGGIVSDKAALVKRAVDEEQIRNAIAKFPDAPIQREIVYSAEKATPHRRDRVP